MLFQEHNDICAQGGLAHMILEDVLREQGSSCRPNAPPGPRPNAPSWPGIRFLCFLGILAVFLAIALCVLALFPVHWQSMRIVDDQGCLRKYIGIGFRG